MKLRQLYRKYKLSSLFHLSHAQKYLKFKINSLTKRQLMKTTAAHTSAINLTSLENRKTDTHSTHRPFPYCYDCLFGAFTLISHIFSLTKLPFELRVINLIAVRFSVDGLCITLFEDIVYRPSPLRLLLLSRFSSGLFDKLE